MTLQSRVLLLVLLASPLAALAGGTATVKSGASKGGSIAVEWRDAHNLRMQHAGRPEYFVMRDGKSYAVMSRDGKPMVVDMAAMSEMYARKDKPGFVSGSFEPTGKSETVAGIAGHVYHATWTDAQGKHEGNAVLTSDPRVVELTQAYLAMADSMADGDAGIKLNLPAAEPGLLRLGAQFRVLTITDKTPPAKDFELPAKPMGLKDLMKPGSG